MKIWKVIFAALVIFGAGVVTGVLTINLKSTPSPRPMRGPPMSMPPRPRVEMIDRLQRELGLTSSQRTNIEQILRESNERTKNIWESAREEHRKLKTNIRESLTPEQQTKCDELFKPRDFHKPGGEQRPRDPRRPPPSADKRPESGSGFKAPQTPATPKP